MASSWILTPLCVFENLPRYMLPIAQLSLLAQSCGNLIKRLRALLYALADLGAESSTGAARPGEDQSPELLLSFAAAPPVLHALALVSEPAKPAKPKKHLPVYSQDTAR